MSDIFTCVCWGWKLLSVGEGKMTIGYPKIVHLGTKDAIGLFADEVVVQEKIDGSQFRFGVFSGQFRCFGRGGEQTEKQDALFRPAIESLREISDQLQPELVYCGEAIAKPRHNVLAYERTPNRHVVLFDILGPIGGFHSPAAMAQEADRLGLERVPFLYEGLIEDQRMLDQLLENSSILGGIVEGVVIKNYTRGIFAKYVAPKFREIRGEKVVKPKGDNFSTLVESLAEAVSNPARWHKAVQHLREAGKLTESPADIGPIIKELQADISIECTEFIRDALLQHAMPLILKRVGPAVAPWYKEQLAKSQFGA